MVLTALMMGLAGGLHCLGMCAPLAMSATAIRGQKFINRLIYNSGRIITYAFLGALVNILGSAIAIPAMSNVLSICLGSLLVVLALTGSTNLRVPFLSPIMQRLTIVLKKAFSTFLSKRNFAAVAGMGMINGLLPCGLTYLALVYCISLNSTTDAFLFMLLFGAGTLPVMLGLTSALQTFFTRFSISSRKAVMMIMFSIGVLMIGRSLYHRDHAGHAHTADGITICSEP